MASRIMALVSVMLLYGCNSYNLRYEAQPQPQNLHVYADYVPLQGAVGFTIDTNGMRLQEAGVEKPGGGELVRPLSIAYPAFGHNAAIGTGVGVGSGHVGVG